MRLMPTSSSSLIRRFHSRRLLLTVALPLAIVAGACGGASQDATTTPTPTPTTITENFSGAIDKNGSVTFPFTVTLPGTIVVTLTSLAPVNSLAIGITLGTWDGAVCTAALSNDNAKLNDQLTGTTAVGGSFCVRVYDVGNVTTTESLALTVAHQ